MCSTDSYFILCASQDNTGSATKKAGTTSAKKAGTTSAKKAGTTSAKMAEGVWADYDAVYFWMGAHSRRVYSSVVCSSSGSAHSRRVVNKHTNWVRSI
jgi:hypothetical protein